MRILPVLAAATLSSALIAAPAYAHPSALGPTAYGYGGGIATVDATATGAGLDVLRHGGNAIDAAVAAAVTLGVTEPFVAGPETNGSVTPRVAAAATAASTALPPWRNTSRPAAVADASTVAIPPPYP